MCQEATDLYGACLTDWGLDWEGAGFTDAGAHLESCEVWSWEESLLGDPEIVDEICVQRAAIFREGTCADYTSINWNEEL